MRTESFELRVTVVAVIAFCFCLLRQPQALLLLAGFALLAQRDAWLNRQVMQALFLALAYSFAALLVDWIFGGLAAFFGFLELYSPQMVLLAVHSAASGIVYLLLIVCAVLAIVRVLRGQDARLPLLGKLADAVFFAVRQETAPQSAPAAPQADISAPQTAAEAPPREESPLPAQTDIAAGRYCSSCGAALQGAPRFCIECGAKNE